MPTAARHVGLAAVVLPLTVVLAGRRRKRLVIWHCHCALPSLIHRISNGNSEIKETERQAYLYHFRCILNHSWIQAMRRGLTRVI